MSSYYNLDIDFMRDCIAEMYPGDKWKRRVAMMRDAQVMAIYYSFRERITKIKKNQNQGGVPDAGFARGISEGEYEQVSFDDYLENKSLEVYLRWKIN